MSPVWTSTSLASIYLLLAVITADDCLSSNTNNPIQYANNFQDAMAVNVIVPAAAPAPTASCPDDWVIAAIPLGSTDTFRCANGGTITNVDFAGWGSYYLTSNGQFNAASSCAKDVTGIVAGACVGQQQCTFSPDTSRFGAACPGLTTLAVRMQCSTTSLTPKNVAKATIPENQKGTLSCKSGEVMVGIDFASYGRQVIAASGFGVDPMFNCNSPKSMSIVQQRCLGRNSCKLTASNKYFDDPCKNVIKTLAVQARCAPLASFPKTKVAFVINEGQKQTLRCPNGGRFGNVLWGGYGKQFRDVNGFQVDPKYKCNSSKPHQIVQSRCQGKTECEIEASNKHFGDPCKKVVKSLAIEIECISF